MRSRPATDRTEPLVFEARLSGHRVAPDPVDTDASASATAVLVGDELTVHGSFTDLSSALRDVEQTPEDPGIHLHPGGPGEVNPYIFGLPARLNDDERSGVYAGRFRLDDEQLALLLSGRLYHDIHTAAHPPGELRDQLRPRDPTGAAARLAIVEQRMGRWPPRRSAGEPPNCTDPDACSCE